MKAPLQLSDFEGLWHIDRRIDDAYGTQSGRFAGTARIAPVSTHHAYVEQGTLTLDSGASFAAERRYLWRETAPGHISIQFDDGRDFHHIALTAGCEADHFCDPDTYRVTYDFARWPEWSTVWQVTGPRKDYRMVTQYTRTA